MNGKSPNILLVLADQHNAGLLGCAGHPQALTPNLDRYYYCIGIGPARWLPAPFKEEVLEETEHTITKRHGDGSIRQEGKPGTHQTIPHEIRPAVTTRAEWDRLKEWLDVDSPLQSPELPAVREKLDRARTATVPVRLGAGSLLGAARNLLGFEQSALPRYRRIADLAASYGYATRSSAWAPPPQTGRVSCAGRWPELPAPGEGAPEIL